MTGGRPVLSVIEGRPDAPVRIALSLVHPRERIDIPVKDVLRIEAKAEQTFFFPELKASKTHPRAHVRLEFKPDIRARIYRLTSQIVEEELQVVVAGEVVTRPIVREPLGIREGFSISAFDLEEAKALERKLREGWIIPDLHVV
jgi:preprotein translocase subunit SecD